MSGLKLVKRASKISKTNSFKPISHIIEDLIRVCGVLLCFLSRFGMCSYVGWQGDFICIKTVEIQEENYPTNDLELDVDVLGLKHQ